MPGDDEERANETQRLVQELAEVRKRMQMRAEQPPLRNGSGAYRAVTPLPFVIAAAKAADARDASEGAPRSARTSPPKAQAEAEPPDGEPIDGTTKSNPEGAAPDKDDPPPTRRRRP